MERETKSRNYHEDDSDGEEANQLGASSHRLVWMRIVGISIHTHLYQGRLILRSQWIGRIISITSVTQLKTAWADIWYVDLIQGPGIGGHRLDNPTNTKVLYTSRSTHLDRDRPGSTDSVVCI